MLLLIRRLLHMVHVTRKALWFMMLESVLLSLPLPLLHSPIDVLLHHLDVLSVPGMILRRATMLLIGSPGSSLSGSSLHLSLWTTGSNSRSTSTNHEPSLLLILLLHHEP